MARAIWNGTVIAQSPKIETADGYVYFPRESVKMGYLKPSSATSVCPWKGMASYYTIAVNGNENRDAAWVYERPKSEAAHIRGMIAFWRGVTIER